MPQADTRVLSAPAASRRTRPNHAGQRSPSRSSAPWTHDADPQSGRVDSTRCTGRGRRGGAPDRSADTAGGWAACVVARDGCSDDSADPPRSGEAATARHSRGRSPWRSRAWRANSTAGSDRARAASPSWPQSTQTPLHQTQNGGGVRERRWPRAARSRGWLGARGWLGDRGGVDLDQLAGLAVERHAQRLQGGELELLGRLAHQRRHRRRRHLAPRRARPAAGAAARRSRSRVARRPSAASSAPPCSLLLSCSSSASVSETARTYASSTNVEDGCT